MVAVARVIDQPSPPRGADAAAIDTEHLSRMTLGELSLQREVLALFDRQADMLLPRIRRGEPAVAAASAHTLKGSARRHRRLQGGPRRRSGRAGPSADRGRDRRPPSRRWPRCSDEAKAEIARLLQALTRAAMR